jgi:hypothetical protein
MHKDKNKKKKILSNRLRELLQGKTIILDCGHRFTLHNLSNTMIITNDGRTYCHNCY